VNSPASDPSQPRPLLYAGLFLVTLATLLLEIGLTRIFSVIIYYHMAFFAVSVTMFGLAFGGVIVHFRSSIFTPEKTPLWMYRFTLAFAVSVAVALALMLAIRFDVTRNRILVPQLLLVAVMLAAPFTCGGVAVALALTRFPRRTNLLYGWDLAGAALGCLLYAPLMTWLGGPRFVLAVAALLGLAALLLAAAAGGRARQWTALIVMSVLAGLTLRGDRMSLFHMRYLRGSVVAIDEFAWEGWNSISRVTVSHDGLSQSAGIAPQLEEMDIGPQRTLIIDSLAATPILKGNGDFDRYYFPHHDVSYAAHALRREGRVAVIGVGGGRDVVAALACGQREVVGIEINGRIIEAFTRVFADYAGNPLDWPGFTLVHDEARSYLTRGRRPFDIIQASLIDTFAATAAGAFVLTENGLYTVEGWRVFLDHLEPDGILTMTRWYIKSNPVESVRLLALARAALEDRGVEEPRRHILMVRTPTQPDTPAQPLATILVSPTPFASADIDAFEKWAAANELIVLATPDRLADPLLAEVLEAPDLKALVAGYRFDISPPTDNRPFFFDVLRWRDILARQYRQGSDYIFSIGLKPIIMLGTLLLTVVVLAAGLVVVPLMLENRRRGGEWRRLSRTRRAGLVTYFIMLGLGYLLVELTLIQQLSLFLGHPAYSLTVCLFTMLLASGVGSMVAPRLAGSPDADLAVARLRRLLALLFVVLLLTLAAAVGCLQALIALPTPARILAAGLVIVPAGLLMGMPFPLGIQLAARRPYAPLAWFWGINGAFSVCASVLTVVLAHGFGLRAAFICGAACYLIAALACASFRLDGDPPAAGFGPCATGGGPEADPPAA
jgi:hypothetical protein